MHRPAVPAEFDRPSETTGSGPQEPVVSSESAYHARQDTTAVTIQHRIPGFGHLRMHPFNYSLSTELLARKSTQSLLAAEPTDSADLVRPAIGRFARPSHPYVAAHPQFQPERHQFVQFQHAPWQRWRPSILYKSTCYFGRQQYQRRREAIDTKCACSGWQRKSPWQFDDGTKLVATFAAGHPSVCLAT